MSRFKRMDKVRELATRARRGGMEPLTGGIIPPGGTATARQLLRRLKAAKDDANSAGLLAIRDYTAVVRRLGDGRTLTPAQANNLGIAYAYLALAQRSNGHWQKAEDALAESKQGDHRNADENMKLVRQARRRAA